MKVVFIGAVDFSESLLDVVIKHSGIELIGVVTKAVSKINADFCSLEDKANENSIDTFIFKNNAEKRAELVDWMKQKNPDLILCFGWSHLISEEVISIPKFGIWGYHPAELPMNRGRHPIIWALALGLKKTASTFFKIDGGADSGPIVSQEIVEILYDDNSKSLYEKLRTVATTQLDKALSSLVDDELEYIEQDHSKANYWRKRSKSDGVIDWRMGNKAIYNLVRALAKPYPGALFEYASEEYTIWSLKENSEKNLNDEPGKVIFKDDKLITVATSDGLVDILEVEPSLNVEVGEYLI